MDLNEIRSKMDDEVDQAAAIADIMSVFSIASGFKNADLPLESIPGGIRFIYDMLETHRKTLSDISNQLTDFIKREKAERT